MKNSSPEMYRLVFMVLHENRHLSTKDLAFKADLSFSTVKKLRLGPKYGGTRNPFLSTIQKLAKVAGMELIPVKSEQATFVFNAARKTIKDAERQQQTFHEQLEAKRIARLRGVARKTA